MRLSMGWVGQSRVRSAGVVQVSRLFMADCGSGCLTQIESRCRPHSFSPASLHESPTWCSQLCMLETGLGNATVDGRLASRCLTRVRVQLGPTIKKKLHGGRHYAAELCSMMKMLTNQHVDRIASIYKGVMRTESSDMGGQQKHTPHHTPGFLSNKPP